MHQQHRATWRFAVLLGLMVSLALANNPNDVNAQDGSAQLKKLLRELEHGNKYDRADAAAELINFKSHYREFVKPLAALMLERDEVLTQTAKRIFHELGSDAVEALEIKPDPTDQKQFRTLCSAINAVGDPCQAYSKDLVAILANQNHKDMNIRLAAMFGLTGFSNGSKEAIPYIIGDLKHDDMNVKLFACRLIIQTGPEAKDAIPALGELLEKGVISERSYALWALAAIGPTDELDVVEATAKQLRKFNVVERQRALIAAGLLGQAAANMESRIRDMMGKDLSNLEGQAAVTLWQVTGNADDSLARLKRITIDFAEYEVEGPRFIGQMGPAAAPLVGFLIERLENADYSVQLVIMDALNSIGKCASSHREQIETFVHQSQSPLVKHEGKKLLASFDQD